METPSGTRYMVVEQKGRDVWRGKSKSIDEAIERGEAGLAVDRVLFSRAAKDHNVTTIMIVIEEQRRIFLTPIADFADDNMARTRTDFRGRAVRVVPYGRFHQKIFGPRLRSRKSTASKSA